MPRDGRSNGPDDGSRGGNSTGYSDSVSEQLGRESTNRASRGPDDGSRAGNSTRSTGGTRSGGGQSANYQSSGPDDGTRAGNTSTDRDRAAQSATQDRSTLGSNYGGSGPDDGFRGVTSPVTGYGAPGPSANAVTGPENYGARTSQMEPSLLSGDLAADWRGTMTPQTALADTPGLTTRQATSVEVRSPRQSRGLSAAMGDTIGQAPDPYELNRNMGSFVQRGTSTGVPSWFDEALVQRESGGRANVVNDLGFSGLYQFGAPRLMDVGVYTPGPTERIGRGGRTWNTTPANTPGKWSGEFNIPGFPEVKTHADFLANPEAQRAAFRSHVAKMDQEIDRFGLGDLIGKEIGGVTVTREGLYAMMHLGGADGPRRASTRDANGTSVADYARLGVAPENAAAAYASAPPGASGPPSVEVLGPRVEVAALPPERPMDIRPEAQRGDPRPGDGIVVAGAAPPEVPGRGLGFAALPPSRPDDLAGTFSDAQAPGAAPSLRDEGAPLDVRPEVQRFAEKYISPPARPNDLPNVSQFGTGPTAGMAGMDRFEQVGGGIRSPNAPFRGPEGNFSMFDVATVAPPSSPVPSPNAPVGLSPQNLTPSTDAPRAAPAPATAPSVFDPTPMNPPRTGLGTAAAPATPAPAPPPTFPTNPPLPPTPRENGVPRVNPRVAAQEQIGPVIAQPSTTRQDGFAATGIDILAGAVPGLGIINGISAVLGGPSLGSLMTQYGAPGFDPTKGMTERDLDRDGGPSVFEGPPTSDEEEEDETEEAPVAPVQRFRTKYLYPTPEERWGGQQYRGGPELRGRAPVETQVPIT